MGGRRVVAAGLVLVIALAGCSPSRPSPSPAPSATATAGATARPSVPADLAGRLAAALDAGRESIGAPGVQAAIVFPDGSIWVGAAGQSTADLPMTPDLLMAIASITKVYTSALVLRLADFSVLSLDDPLLRWVPDAANADGVTIRHLLTHTSGIASDDPALPPVCSPGTCYSYSNAGYGDLGRVIEAATGQSYAESLRARFLAPLGLRSTFYPREEGVAGEPAMGHIGDEEALATDAATLPEGPGWVGASGGIVSTAEDTARFFDALFGGAPLGESGRAALTDVEVTRGLPGTTECNAQAMLGRAGGPNGESWNHGGNAGWFRSWVEHYTAQDLTIAVLSNSNAFPRAIADALVAEALDGAAAEPASGHCEDAIEIRAADGSTRRLAGEPGHDGKPAWSPDGGSIAWLAIRGDEVDILVSRADGTDIRRLTDDAAHEMRAAWSPDGETVVYSSDVDGDHELYLLRVADGSTTRLTDNDVHDWAPTWSPDGRSIAFIRTGGGQALRVMTANGSGDRAVDGASDGAWWPAWSPDGIRIAYELGGAIEVVPATGGVARRLAVPQLRVVRLPAWAPGNDILFSSDGDLYAAAADGSDLRRLTATPTEELTPAWAPDGATIAYQVSYWVNGTP